MSQITKSVIQAPPTKDISLPPRPPQQPQEVPPSVVSKSAIEEPVRDDAFNLANL